MNQPTNDARIYAPVSPFWQSFVAMVASASITLMLLLTFIGVFTCERNLTEKDKLFLYIIWALFLMSFTLTCLIIKAGKMRISKWRMAFDNTGKVWLTSNLQQREWISVKNSTIDSICFLSFSPMVRRGFAFVTEADEEAPAMLVPVYIYGMTKPQKNAAFFEELSLFMASCKAAEKDRVTTKFIERFKPHD